MCVRKQLHERDVQYLQINVSLDGLGEKYSPSWLIIQPEEPFLIKRDALISNQLRSFYYLQRY